VSLCGQQRWPEAVEGSSVAPGRFGNACVVSSKAPKRRNRAQLSEEKSNRATHLCAVKLRRRLLLGSSLYFAKIFAENGTFFSRSEIRREMVSKMALLGGALRIFAKKMQKMAKFVTKSSKNGEKLPFSNEKWSKFSSEKWYF
jgi:hypothetical protein